MSVRHPFIASIMGAVLVLSAAAATAQVRVTEVAPWSSGNSPVGADWFEVTNFGTSSVDLTGWRVDDASNSFAASVALNGITSIAAGESVIFVEGAAAKAQDFLNVWFGSPTFSGVRVGTYSGSGIGLSTDGDAVNLFNSAGQLQANVSFGLSDALSPFQTFDNSAGLNGVTLGSSSWSQLGVNGAFAAPSGFEIGSPSLVPEPETFAMLLSGLALLAGVARRRRQAA